MHPLVGIADHVYQPVSLLYTPRLHIVHNVQGRLFYWRRKTVADLPTQRLANPEFRCRAIGIVPTLIFVAVFEAQIPIQLHWATVCPSKPHIPRLHTS